MDCVYQLYFKPSFNYDVFFFVFLWVRWFFILQKEVHILVVLKFSRSLQNLHFLIIMKNTLLYRTRELFWLPTRESCCYRFDFIAFIGFDRISSILDTCPSHATMQCSDPGKLDKKPCKILWDVPWEELMALELAKVANSQPSHLIIHLKSFKRTENFARIIKCHIEEISGREPQAVRICSVVSKLCKEYQADMKCLVLKVSIIGYIHFIVVDIKLFD